MLAIQHRLRVALSASQTVVRLSLLVPSPQYADHTACTDEGTHFPMLTTTLPTLSFPLPESTMACCTALASKSTVALMCG